MKLGEEEEEEKEEEEEESEQKTLFGEGALDSSGRGSSTECSLMLPSCFSAPLVAPPMDSTSWILGSILDSPIEISEIDCLDKKACLFFSQEKRRWWP